MTPARRKATIAALVAVFVAIVVWLQGGDPQKERDALEGVCAGLRQLDLGGTELCHHGGDELDETFAVPAAEAAFEETCKGRYKIKVLAAHPSDRTLQGITTKQRRRLVRTAVRAAASFFRDTTGGYDLRFVCNDKGRVAVRFVTLGPVGPDDSFTFGDYVDSMTAQGYTDARRSYLAFYDDNAYVRGDVTKISRSSYPYGGQGSVFPDSRKIPDNLNNTGSDRAKYAFVDGYSGFVALHEVLHNLGAVQLDAPHSDGGYHCTDEQDVECYGAAMATPCPGAPEANVDCGHDDYFHPGTPAPSIYLGGHFNIADSKWVRRPA